MATGKIFKETKYGKILELPGFEPLYLASPETNDPGMISYSETLFWLHSFIDHSKIMATLIPDTPQLSKYKESAQKHTEIFMGLMEKAKAIDPEDKDLLEILNDTERHGKIVAESLTEMISEQKEGELNTLMWPSFMDHLRRESEYFLDHKEQISKKEVQYQKSEIVPFWTEIMAEHAMFSAHLLDPEEIDAIDQVWEANFKLYEDLETFEKNDGVERLQPDIEGLIKLKAILLDGVVSGEIASIILPELAEHMRHEALYFRDVLNRAE